MQCGTMRKFRCQFINLHIMNPKLKTIAGFLILSVLLFSCNEKQPANFNSKLFSADSQRKVSANPYRSLDISPLDISYFPDSFPLMKMENKTHDIPVMRVLYGRPHKKGRVIFGTGANVICRYGQPWRLGANEASEIEFYKNVSIAGKNIQQGRYIIYCVPQKDKWDVILNSNIFSWGLHIDSTKDIFRTEIPVMKQLPQLEDFTMVFKESLTGADLIMAWDSVKVQLPIDFAK